jgi:DNA polymerase I-like protein with 3'-5' exonuclease and polymerase domains
MAKEVAALVSREMEQVVQLKVPLTAEAKYGKSWFEAK